MIAIEENIRKVTRYSKILKNKSKDGDYNFMVVSAKPKELLREEKGWLTDDGHNEMCATCSTLSPNRKDGIIQTSPVHR